MTELARYLSKVDTSAGPDACWPWTGGTFDSGYGRFATRRRSVRAHRWGYLALVGPIPPGLCVCHSCDFRPCQNPTHWFLGTNAVNSADMVAKGRSASGVRNPASKLTVEQVIEIKRLLPLTADGKGRTRRGQLTQGDIAIRFGVTQPVISAIKRGLVWSHVT